MPISAYAHLPLLCLPLPALFYLSSNLTPLVFIPLLVGKNILGTLRTNPLYLHSPPGVQICSDTRLSTKRLYSLPGCKSGESAESCNQEGSHLPQSRDHRSRLSLVEHGSHDSCPARHLQSWAKQMNLWPECLKTGKDAWREEHSGCEGAGLTLAKSKRSS